MALQGWDPSYSVNDVEMDSDHKKLVELISNLHEAMKKGQSKDVIEKMISDLQSYASTHFVKEEALLVSKAHPDLTSQKQQHVLFLEKINEFKISFEKGRTAIALELLPFLNNWFLNHIMKVDIKYK